MSWVNECMEALDIEQLRNSKTYHIQAQKNTDEFSLKFPL